MAHILHTWLWIAYRNIWLPIWRKGYLYFKFAFLKNEWGGFFCFVYVWFLAKNRILGWRFCFFLFEIVRKDLRENDWQNFKTFWNKISNSICHFDTLSTIELLRFVFFQEKVTRWPFFLNYTEHLLLKSTICIGRVSFLFCFCRCLGWQSW